MWSAPITICHGLLLCEILICKLLCEMTRNQCKFSQLLLCKIYKCIYLCAMQSGTVTVWRGCGYINIAEIVAVVHIISVSYCMLKIGNKYRQNNWWKTNCSYCWRSRINEKCFLNSLEKLKENDNYTIRKQEILYCREAAHAYNVIILNQTNEILITICVVKYKKPIN